MQSESIKYIKSKISAPPQIALVLGSGLGDFGSHLHKPVVIPTKEIPAYPLSTVPGHAGRILFGKISFDGKESPELMVFQGRIHFYECDDIQKVIHPITVAASLGVKTLFVTNAAGGINRRFVPGDLMFIRDFINLTYVNPLLGRSIKASERISGYFDERMAGNAFAVARSLKIPVQEGVYCWTKGPSYETSSEISMMEKLGADAVGMSTVPEVIAAVHAGMKVLGISCITNMATGISGTKLSHAEVTDTANLVKKNFTRLVSAILVTM